MNQESRDLIAEYFRKKSPTALFVWGVLLLPVFGVGLLLVILGVGRLKKNRRLPSDDQMDQWLIEDLARMKERALEKTSLNRQDTLSDPVMITGLRFWNVAGAEIGLRLGDDRKIRFTPVEVTVINFTENQLVSYQCALDLITGNPLNEGTEEYFYRDIVSVSTLTESMTWDKQAVSKNGLSNTPLSALMKSGKLQLNEADTFVLTTSGGTSLQVVLQDRRLIEALGGGEIPVDPAEKAIASVRKMLREKKAVPKPPKGSEPNS